MQKLTKSMPRRRSIQGVYTREKYLCKNLGVEEGGGHLLKGSIFRELTVYIYCICRVARFQLSTTISRTVDDYIPIVYISHYMLQTRITPVSELVQVFPGVHGV